jgi:hypothetical protein
MLFEAYASTSRSSTELFMTLDQDGDGLLQKSEVVDFLNNLAGYHLESINKAAITALHAKSERVRRGEGGEH